MFTITAKQHANLLEARDKLLPTLTEKDIYPRLERWCERTGPVDSHCGSPACFGGWVARHKPFQSQGVITDGAGAPRMRITGSNGIAPPHQVAATLFGCGTLFEPRCGYSVPDEGFQGSDLELIKHRIQWVLDNSQVAP